MPDSNALYVKPEPLLFLKKFLRHGKRVASFTPSSRAMARAMCTHVRSDTPQIIIELGAGTGAVTTEVIHRMHPESTFIAIEIDPTFAGHLRFRCPQARVVEADVYELSDVLDRFQIGQVDLILSGLPTPSLPRKLNRRILETIESQSPQLTFSQLTIMPWVYKPMYERLFGRVDFKLVLRNAPPGGVYHCQNLRPDWRHYIPGSD